MRETESIYKFDDDIYCTERIYKDLVLNLKSAINGILLDMSNEAKAKNIRDESYLQYDKVKDSLRVEIINELKHSRKLQKKYNVRFIKKGECFYLCDRNDYKALFFLKTFEKKEIYPTYDRALVMR